MRHSRLKFPFCENVRWGQLRLEPLVYTPFTVRQCHVSWQPLHFPSALWGWNAPFIRRWVMVNKMLRALQMFWLNNRPKRESQARILHCFAFTKSTFTDWTELFTNKWKNYRTWVWTLCIFSANLISVSGGLIFFSVFQYLLSKWAKCRFSLLVFVEFSYLIDRETVLRTFRES